MDTAGDHDSGERHRDFDVLSRAKFTLPGLYTSCDDKLPALAPLSPSRTQVVLAPEMGRGAGGEGSQGNETAEALV